MLKEQERSIAIHAYSATATMNSQQDVEDKTSNGRWIAYIYVHFVNCATEHRGNHHSGRHEKPATLSIDSLKHMQGCKPVICHRLDPPQPAHLIRGCLEKAWLLIAP
jgi:hypothetical protein